jgi:Dullard-like phosphatase family protein
MNVDSQFTVQSRFQNKVLPKKTETAKQYYVKHFAQGLHQHSEHFFDHLAQAHSFLGENSIDLPENCEPLFLPCNPEDRHKKVLVIDLDETLIHCQIDDPTLGDLEIEIDEGEYGYVTIRPYALSFLRKMSKFYEIVVFTASEKSYADAVLDELDPTGLIKHRLYREHCLKLGHNLYTKDLRVINRDLSQMVLVDNSAICFVCQP